MYKNKKVSAIILMSGKGKRFGYNKNKVLLKLKRAPVFMYSVKEFENNKYIDEIILCINKTDENQVNKYIKNKNIKIVYGGEERKDSVYNALKKTYSDIVLIHDGARPLIKNKYVNLLLKAMNKYDGATLGTKAVSTIKISDESNEVVKTTNRRNTWEIQTPQCFKTEELKKGYKVYYKDKLITDDTYILEKMNKKVKIIEGNKTNIKITYKDDLNICELFLDKK